MGSVGGQLLARHRKQHRHLSQQDLANQVGASRSMIAQLELGERQPSSDLLTRIAQVLQLDESEQAMLFLAYGKVQANQESMMPYVRAALCLDQHLSPEQVVALIDLAVQEYTRATGSDGSSTKL